MNGHGTREGVGFEYELGGQVHRRGTQCNLGPMQRLTLCQKHTLPIPTAEQLSSLDLSILIHRAQVLVTTHGVWRWAECSYLFQQHTPNSGLAGAAFTPSQHHPLPQPSWLRSYTSLSPPWWTQLASTQPSFFVIPSGVPHFPHRSGSMAVYSCVWGRTVSFTNPHGAQEGRGHGLPAPGDCASLAPATLLCFCHI